MLRFPFEQRHMQSYDIDEDIKNDNKMEENEDSGSEELSPELKFMMSMAMKDDEQSRQMRKMFEDVLPYVTGEDKKTIEKMLRLSGNTGQSETGSRGSKMSLSGYSKQNREQDLMDFFEMYADKQGGDAAEIKEAIRETKKYEQMMKRFEKLNSMDEAKPEDMIEMMTSLLPGEDMKEIRNMQSMMKLFSNMGGMKPEDMMKFMNLNKK